jgi:hypothetical protein
MQTLASESARFFGHLQPPFTATSGAGIGLSASDLQFD